MKVVAFVPIRLNSKRVVGKNLKMLGGKPLMQYILETLVKVNNIDEVYVYCSSEEVIPYLPQGVKFLKRSTALDGDETLGKEIYEAFVKDVDADVYMLAHTTSPFIKAGTIENAIDKVVNGGHDSSFSAQKIQTFTWFNGKPLNYSLKDIPRTQTIEPVYVELPGWQQDMTVVKSEGEFPQAFNDYIAFLERELGVPIAIVSVGPDREQTIERNI
jgi:CMP-N-acetylneuraminic acid synthetase